MQESVFNHQYLKKINVTIMNNQKRRKRTLEEKNFVFEELK